MDESLFNNKQPINPPYSNQNIYEQSHPNAPQSQLYQNYTTEQFMQLSYQQQQYQINQNVNYFYNQNLNLQAQQLPPSTSASQQHQLQQTQTGSPQLPPYYQIQQHNLNNQKLKQNILPSSSVSSTPSTSTSSSTPSSSSSSSLNAGHTNNTNATNLIEQVQIDTKNATLYQNEEANNKFNNNYNHVYPNISNFDNIQKNYSPSKRVNDENGHHSSNSPSENYVYGIKKTNPGGTIIPSLPKYGKPQLCITNLLVQTAKSKQIVKPQRRLAIIPPTSLNNSSNISNNNLSSNDNIVNMDTSNSNLNVNNNNSNNNSNYEYLYSQDIQNLRHQQQQQQQQQVLQSNRSNNNQIQSEFNMNHYQYQYYNQFLQSQSPHLSPPPPPQSIPPPPPIETNNNIFNNSQIGQSQAQQRQPPPLQPPHSLSSMSQQQSQNGNYNQMPLPPPQRPVSPPNIPPLVQRNYNHYMDNFIHPNPSTHPNYIHHLPPPQLPPPPPPQLPPQIHYSSRPNNLLNTVLNNSFNSERNKNFNTSTNNPTNFDFESSFNNSTCSSVHNNSVYNNSNANNLNCSNSNNPNYQALLISPNLRTLFDRKKPPPPYPGKQINNQHQQQQNQNSEAVDNLMDTNDEESNSMQTTTAHQQPSNNLNQTINSSAFQSSSIIRTCSPQAFKFFMEQHAENVLKHHKAREFRRNQLEAEMTKASLAPTIKDQMRKLLRQKETNYLRLRRAKMNKSMFEHIKVLGLGAFGEVDLVRKKDDRQHLYAMKILHKSDVFNRNQAAHVKAERDILAEADNEWVVKLYYSFQDDENLYFVMDYVPGGDLMNLLIKLQIFDEKLARFYIGELTCAIESVHNLGFIHRDIKPDNILIDKNGHIKLTDFGLCTGFHWTHNSKNYLIDDAYDRILERKMNNMNTISGDKRTNQRLMAHSLVGTPNYIAPEILSRKGYTKSCDWWSVGVILYEMVVGEPPFRDDTALGTQNKVINWRQTLRIPDDCNLSVEAKDLIFNLCTDAEFRFGAENIKQHGFFRNFDFGPNLRRSLAPYIPTIKHPTDTSNFETIDHSVLADRKIKIEEMHRQHQLKQKMNLYNNNYNSNDHFNNHNDSIMNNSSSMINHTLYEFTFRRFFDEAYSSDNFFRCNNEETNSFSKFIQNISTTSKGNEEEEKKADMSTNNESMNTDKDDKSKQAVSDKSSSLSPSLTQMMASISTASKSPIKNATEAENSTVSKISILV